MESSRGPAGANERIGMVRRLLLLAGLAGSAKGSLPADKGHAATSRGLEGTASVPAAFAAAFARAADMDAAAEAAVGTGGVTGLVGGRGRL